MKLIIVLMTTVFLQISLASEAQKVTLSEKNASLESIFKKIRTQTGYDFFGDINLLKNAKKVNINVNNVSLEQALANCLKDQNLTYVISSKIIVIRQGVQNQSNLDAVLAQDVTIYGKVLDEENKPLVGATVTIKKTNKSTKTNKDGVFSLQVAPNDVIIFSYVGYESQEVKVVNIKESVPFIITLQSSTSKLKQVEVVNTGYQILPKERATGSFQTITAKQLEHSTSPNLLRRLEGITTGLDFNNNLPQNPTNSSKFRVPTLSALTIRGKNNLNPAPSTDPNVVSGQPLVVIDGIPSPYSIDKLNPNDVESVNILQDAASASIWGSRAANGVIVVTTKKGRFQTPTSISFDANLAISDKMDLFYRKVMSTSDFIDAQLAQLNYNFSIDGQTVPDPQIPNQPDYTIAQSAISPVAEIWNSWKRNKITDAQYKNQIDALRNNDIRNDYSKYFLRNSVAQNYNLSASGGIKNYAYRLSGNYGKTLNNTQQSDANRMSIIYNASLKPVKNMSLDASINYNQQNQNEQGGGALAITGDGLYPYSRLVDDAGNPIAVPKSYRKAFLDSLTKKYGDKVLDMSFKPLEDMKQGYLRTKNQLMNINLSAAYQFSPVISASITYNNAWGLNEQNQLRGQNSFYMKELINRFTDPSTLARVIPLGGFYIPSSGKSNNQVLRAQVSANKIWGEKHELNAIAGVEGSQNYSNLTTNWLYGYNEQSKNVNNALPFGVPIPFLFIDPSVGTVGGIIPYVSNYSDFRVRAFSLYSNAAYTYDKRYTLSASIRNDYSSIFGEGTNDHGATYFSVGGKWDISKEKFYNLSWLPYLGLKATFGYNGNQNALVSPRPLVTYSPPAFIGYRLPYASTTGATNRDLRPEKAAFFNLVLNFGTRNSRIIGNLEYYIRKTTDLITNTSLDPSTGFSTLFYNAADLRSTGVDFSLNTLNLQLKEFSWRSTFLMSYNRVKVTDLFTDKPNTAGQQISNNPPFNKGADLSRLYAYRWAGLDPQTGDPMGYVDGQAVRVTGDLNVYNKIYNAPISTAHYFGSAVPVYYGSFINTFSYGNFSASLNFMYKLGYYFRRSPYDVLRYSQLLNTNMIQGEEYARRWKNPGDEKFTNVPSMIFPISPGGITDNRDSFYYNSEINVLKGDHVRLQEINLSYTLKSIWAIKSPRIYANVNNLGIVWRANKLGIDPDINDYPNPRTYSIGLSASF
ncbi:SusC/RagA family TonB-linked outer membrane protein [Pedobacter gandavensis]|uniref:SusC/RagA family TonB-linked outer membrane protein n=1 Tax=Pedobacter gandavensis TaxID=2679963 RepID=UPI002479D90E|nr:SusC/RagA family TonB-linked outer membrane protein [Pedobacter gandavensis]WGQ08878.1 SusC/RagA family TonB-linked outer membrane protein [Pedobacter gandavensis]